MGLTPPSSLLSLSLNLATVDRSLHLSAIEEIIRVLPYSIARPCILLFSTFPLGYSQESKELLHCSLTNSTSRIYRNRRRTKHRRAAITVKLQKGAVSKSSISWISCGSLQETTGNSPFFSLIRWFQLEYGRKAHSTLLVSPSCPLHIEGTTRK